MLGVLNFTLLTGLGAALTLESSAKAEKYNNLPLAFTTTMRIPVGMDAGAPTWFGATHECTDPNGLRMAYGSDGLNPELQWNFYEDRGYFRIENVGKKNQGCFDSAWLRPNTPCNDHDVRREANVYDEGLWKVEPTGEGTYELISYVKDLNCRDAVMGATPDGKHFRFTYNDGSGRTEWQFSNTGGDKAQEITKITGSWALFASGSGGVLATLTRSVENSQGKTVGNESTFEVSVSASVSVGMEVFGASTEASIESGASSSRTESSEVSSQLTNASESTCTASCEAVEGKRAYLYQWKKITSSATSALSMSTCHYACHYEHDTHPLCPPSDCQDQECTSCVECKECERRG